MKYIVRAQNKTAEFVSFSAAEAFAIEEGVELSAIEEVPFVPAPKPVVIPDVTPRQFRQALVLSGVNLSQVEDAINQLPEPSRQLAMIEWEYSVAFIRSNPFVAAVAQLLGWTDAQLDALWLLARRL